MQGDFGKIRANWNDKASIWPQITAIYLLLMMGMIGLGMLVRKRTTSFYNLDKSLLENYLPSIFEASGIKWSRNIGGLHLETISQQNPASTSSAKTSPQLIPSQITAFIQIQSFGSLSHSTIYWIVSHPFIRLEIESELDKVLSQVEVSPANVSSWFMTASLAIFLVMFVWMGFLIYWIIFTPRSV